MILFETRENDKIIKKKRIIIKVSLTYIQEIGILLNKCLTNSVNNLQIINILLIENP